MQKREKQSMTAFGHRLVVEESKASSSSCWNAILGTVVMSYEWIDTNSSGQEVIFWARINQKEMTFDTHITCERNKFSYAHDTSGRSFFHCKAQARVTVGFNANNYIEIAPNINGSWDTYGHSNNYHFSF